MANKTRVDNYHQKKGVSVAVIRIGADEMKEFTEAGDYEVVSLPPRSVITDAYVHTMVASDAGAVTLGTAAGGTEVLTAGDSTSVGKSGTFAGQVHTGSGLPLFLSVAAKVTTGDFIVVVEYLEYTKSTGEYTKLT